MPAWELSERALWQVKLDSLWEQAPAYAVSGDAVSTHHALSVVLV